MRVCITRKGFPRENTPCKSGWTGERCLVGMMLGAVLMLGIEARGADSSGGASVPDYTERYGLAPGSNTVQKPDPPSDPLEKCRHYFLTGDYETCIELAREGIDERGRNENWPYWLTRALLTVGRYEQAEEAIKNGMSRHRTSIRLRLLGRDVLQSVGKLEDARDLIQEINYLAGNRRWAYQDPTNQVVLGRAALLLGADPKLVLDNFFEPAKSEEKPYREAYLAGGELALEKHDFDLAAKTFNAAVELFPQDASMYYGLARAFSPSDQREMLRLLEQALKLNPNHVPSLLLHTDYLVDAEEYELAEETLKEVTDVNPWQPKAWAYRAVLEHLKGNPKGEIRSRQNALRYWPTNPEVDHLIGQKLSQKYRFEEGSTYQRRALQMDEEYLPAKIQLAQDLLRLGQEEEGWRLAEQVNRKDGYDVSAYNLVTLRDTMQQFTTLTNEHFIVRMDPHEADIYGEDVLKLLERARESLSPKYGMQPEQPTIVEIFPSQGDFAVRTFGMPGNPGYLGVCFGRVITANSPAANPGSSINWEAVLWHEFCHVITLQKTRNKMPRWLSEGISVYEEKEANPVWGQEMTPRYREMILDGELTPVSDLSAAFLAPKDGEYLQFAYYESSLVVEYLVDRFGMDALRKVLDDLAQDVPINDAIARHTTSLETIEKEFEEFAWDRAKQLAPKLDWAKPEESGLPFAQSAWNWLNADNYYRLKNQATESINLEKWEEAKAPLEKLIRLFPEQTGSDNAYALLARVHRQLNETEQERKVLSQWAGQSDEASSAYLRLMELGVEAEDWAAVRENAERFLAVNPLLPQPHRFLARASEALEQTEEAIVSYRKLLNLDPANPAMVHYRLASLLHESGGDRAKRHVLQALEQAPRFRDAHRLLLDIHDAGGKSAQENEPPDEKEEAP